MSADSLFIKRNRTAGAVVTVAKTRPADTTAYASGDVIAESTSAGTIWTFPGVGREPGRGAFIDGVALITSVSQTLKLDAELFLFDAAPAAQNDNVAFAPNDTEMEACIGVIELYGAYFKQGSGNGVTAREGLAHRVVCSATATSIFGVLVARNAYVPASAEKLTLRLKLTQD